MSDIKLPETSKRIALRKKLTEEHMQVWRTMLMAVEAIYDHLEAQLATKDCTYPRFRLLFSLYFDAPLSAAQLASRLRVSRGNMSTFIKRIEEDGLIVPCPYLSTPNRPKFFLSPKGTKYAEELMDYHFSNIKKLQLKLSPAAIKDLKKMKEQMDAANVSKK